MTESESSPAQPAANPALPLEELELTPEWVKTSGKSHADYPGPERPSKRDGRRSGRDRFRERDGERRPRPPRPPGSESPRAVRPERRREGPPRSPAPERRPPPATVSTPKADQFDVTFQAEEKGFEGMLEAMKQNPRAYALFDIAKLILNKPERHHVKLARKPAADGTRAPLFLVTPGENVFLRQEDAVRFALRQHAAMIFREKKTVVDPPKGNFTFVNRCGITGMWLGPPNYHEYQSRLIRHHQQRLRHMPFAEFQSHIQTVKDPDAVKAWVDSVSSKTEYECILDAEPKSFMSRDELEKHFLENHLAQFVTSAPELRVSGLASRQLQNPVILEVIRTSWLDERRFPMKTANDMRGRFRHEGFHFFKSPKGITYISRVKPQRFESIGHLSERIQKIILYLRAHFGCKRKHLIDHLLPQLSGADPTGEPAAAVASAAPVPLSVASDPPSTIEAGAVPPATPQPEVSAPTVLAPEGVANATPAAEATAPASPAPVPDTAAAASPAVQPSTDEDQLLADLHWLIRDGYVVEFSDGRLWALADKPPPPPPKPAAPPQADATLTPESPAPATVAPSEDGAGPPVASAAETGAESSASVPPVPAGSGDDTPSPTASTAP